MAPITAMTKTPMAVRLSGALALLGTMALSGCSGLAGRLPLQLFVALGSNADENISEGLRESFRSRIMPLQESFRRLHPDTHFQMGLYPESDMARTLARRNAEGLAPDVLLLTGDLALQLLEAGLIDPFPLSTNERRLFNPEDLRRLSTPDGRLAGMPLLVFPQLSCFNPRQMPTPPATARQLLEASASGQPIGLTTSMDSLLWSVGSLGALPALIRLSNGQDLTPTAADRQALGAWLSWLQEAGIQQRVTFYPDQQTAEAELVAGRVAWIPCRSSAVNGLRRQMGGSLAVAPLPDGNGHQASPPNRLRVAALGRNSSPRGRERALEYMRFTVNPLNQRSLTLGSQSMLPANRFVNVPAQSSQTLATLVRAADQGRQANPIVALVHNNDRRLPALQTLITALVYGEINATEATPQLIRILQERP